MAAGPGRRTQRQRGLASIHLLRWDWKLTPAQSRKDAGRMIESLLGSRVGGGPRAKEAEVASFGSRIT